MTFFLVDATVRIYILVKHYEEDEPLAQADEAFFISRNTKTHPIRQSERNFEVYIPQAFLRLSNTSGCRSIQGAIFDTNNERYCDKKLPTHY
jgi:hypothetical protein